MLLKHTVTYIQTGRQTDRQTGRKRQDIQDRLADRHVTLTAEPYVESGSDESEERQSWTFDKTRGYREMLQQNKQTNKLQTRMSQDTKYTRKS